MRRIICAAVIVALTACAGSPQRLPVTVSDCRAVRSGAGYAIGATIRNDAYTPIAGVTMSADFYSGFRYRTYDVAARLPRELDPGDRRSMLFAGGAPPAAGAAIRCLITRIDYLDGTTAVLTR